MRCVLGVRVCVPGFMYDYYVSTHFRSNSIDQCLLTIISNHNLQYFELMSVHAPSKLCSIDRM